MAVNKGKKFEEKFEENWKTCFPKQFIFRLRDQVSGYKIVSQNPCDYICFTNNKLFLVECKSHEGASINFSVIPQYERLLAYKNMQNVFPVIIIWFVEKDIVLWVPIETAEQIIRDGNKSIQLKMLKTGKYDIKVVPSIKKRVFMDSNYLEIVQDL